MQKGMCILALGPTLTQNKSSLYKACLWLNMSLALSQILANVDGVENPCTNYTYKLFIDVRCPLTTCKNKYIPLVIIIFFRPISLFRQSDIKMKYYPTVAETKSSVGISPLYTKGDYFFFLKAMKKNVYMSSKTVIIKETSKVYNLHLVNDNIITL